MERVMGREEGAHSEQLKKRQGGGGGGGGEEEGGGGGPNMTCVSVC